MRRNDPHHPDKVDHVCAVDVLSFALRTSVQSLFGIENAIVVFFRCGFPVFLFVSQRHGVCSNDAFADVGSFVH